jgi:hypothetical protein
MIFIVRRAKARNTTPRHFDSTYKSFDDSTTARTGNGHEERVIQRDGRQEAGEGKLNGATRLRLEGYE